jgi:hypothetical protein
MNLKVMVTKEIDVEVLESDNHCCSSKCPHLSIIQKDGNNIFLAFCKIFSDNDPWSTDDSSDISWKNNDDGTIQLMIRRFDNCICSESRKQIHNRKDITISDNENV